VSTPPAIFDLTTHSFSALREGWSESVATQMNVVSARFRPQLLKPSTM